MPTPTNSTCDPTKRAPAVFRSATQHPITPPASLHVIHALPPLIVAISVRFTAVLKLSPKFSVVGGGRAYVPARRGIRVNDCATSNEPTLSITCSTTPTTPSRDTVEGLLQEQGPACTWMGGMHVVWLTPTPSYLIPTHVILSLLDVRDRFCTPPHSPPFPPP